ncbi:MAG: multidrug ABC transporter ATP-binding protein, partial [Rhodospirillaceae bacterium]|nr:multidrug ABC transporter ATP-binding protein [Rhodospirillaceae bacterium]
NELALDRTVLVVAHRLETVRASDSILVVEGGRIVEQGRHEDLVQNGGLYASMAASGGLIEDAGGWR